VTMVEDALTGLTYPGNYLNIFPPDQRATAVFNNDVLVLAAPLALMDLGPNQSNLWYKVVASGINYLAQNSWTVVSDTPWIPFNVIHPAVDTAVYGLDGVPMLVDGQKNYVRVDRASAVREGTILPTVLLLHHFNVAGKRLELVRLNLSDDADADALPDWWEMASFKNLTAANAHSDTDRDGATDYAEYWSGTDPNSAQSAFKLLSVKPLSRSGVELKWASQAGKSYRVERSDDIGRGFAAISPGSLPATPPTNTFVDTNALRIGACFYRIKLYWP
jgi:hypothetical protein